MKIKEVISYLESKCPLSYQESYDNCGLITGDTEKKITGVLLCLDSTEDVIHEALKLKCNLIIAHHPILFSPIKKLTGKNYAERVIISAVKHDICIYAMHTNLDNIYNGVNHKIAEKIGLNDLSILSPKKGLLKKLVTFCPTADAEDVRDAIFAAGGGQIGNYSECSFNAPGIGTFKADNKANPYVGKIGKRHNEKEERIETIYPADKEQAVLNALFSAHPYEEVAYDLYPLDNLYRLAGSGMIGELTRPMNEKEFLAHLKKVMKLSCIRHSPLLGKTVKKVALCGGSGSFLLPDAICHGADMFVTADFKYHQFFDADKNLVITDIGHFESEQFTPEIIYGMLTEKFSTFALQFSKTKTNPVNYY
ncbi:MAG: Nif3-like dinuclear metal center hexameric protein [Bacteroidia bacterium]